MLIYFILLLILFLFYNKTKKVNNAKTNRMYMFIQLGAFMLLYSLRDVSVGCDMIQYKYGYDHTIKLSILKYIGYEKGFQIFNYICHDVFRLSWQWYLVICSFLLFLPLFLIFNKKSNNQYYSTFLFLTIGNFTMYLSGLRQSLACSICLLSMYVYDNDKFTKTIRFIISIMLLWIAYSFHNSAYAFIIFYIIKIIGPKLRKKDVLLALCITLLSLIFGDKILVTLSVLFPTRYQNRSVLSYFNLNPLLVVIGFLIPLFVIIFLPTDKYNRYNEGNSLLLIFTILSLFALCISYQNGQVGRVSYYFNTGYCILIPNTLSKMSKSNKIVSKIIISIICLLYFIIGTKGGILHIDEYKFFWS